MSHADQVLNCVRESRLPIGANVIKGLCGLTARQTSGALAYLRERGAIEFVDKTKRDSRKAKYRAVANAPATRRVGRTVVDPLAKEAQRQQEVEERRRRTTALEQAERALAKSTSKSPIAWVARSIVRIPSVHPPPAPTHHRSTDIAPRAALRQKLLAALENAADPIDAFECARLTGASVLRIKQTLSVALSLDEIHVARKEPCAGGNRYFYRPGRAPDGFVIETQMHRQQKEIHEQLAPMHEATRRHGFRFSPE